MGIVEELKKKYDIDEEWLGLEIHPETPIEGIDLNKRFGKDNLERMKENLVKSGSQYGIHFGELKQMPNSHNALQAAEYARSVGKLHEYHQALMDVYFRDGKDIGSVDVLTDIGSSLGLNSDDLLDAIKEKRFLDKLNKDADTAHEYGVSSTPTFIVDDEYMIVGAQPMEVFEKLFNSIENER